MEFLFICLIGWFDFLSPFSGEMLHAPRQAAVRGWSSLIELEFSLGKRREEGILQRFRNYWVHSLNSNEVIIETLKFEFLLHHQGKFSGSGLQHPHMNKRGKCCGDKLEKKSSISNSDSSKHLTCS